MMPTFRWIILSRRGKYTGKRTVRLSVRAFPLKRQNPFILRSLRLLIVSSMPKIRSFRENTENMRWKSQWRSCVRLIKTEREQSGARRNDSKQADHDYRRRAVGRPNWGLIGQVF